MRWRMWDEVEDVVGGGGWVRWRMWGEVEDVR